MKGIQSTLTTTMAAVVTRPTKTSSPFGRIGTHFLVDVHGDQRRARIEYRA